MGKCDLYITGSNSHMLSSDSMTNFRGVATKSVCILWVCQRMAGRAASDIPGISAPRGHAVGAECSKRPGKREVSQRPFRENVLDGHHGKARRPPYRGPREWFLASSAGSFVNPANIAEKFQAEGVSGVSRNTVAEYVRYMEDAFLFQTAKRFDIRGKDYLSGQRKHYFSGLGLRNARLNYRQFDRPRLLENAVYNEMASLGYSVDEGRMQNAGESEKCGWKTGNEIHGIRFCRVNDANFMSLGRTKRPLYAGTSHIILIWTTF